MEDGMLNLLSRFHGIVILARGGSDQVERKLHSLFTLEALESRVLLSADLAAAVQVQAPQPTTPHDHPAAIVEVVNRGSDATQGPVIATVMATSHQAPGNMPVRLGTAQTNGPLAAGGHENLAIGLSIPDTLAPGPYSLFAVLHSGNAQAATAGPQLNVASPDVRLAASAASQGPVVSQIGSPSLVDAQTVSLTSQLSTQASQTTSPTVVSQNQLALQSPSQATQSNSNSMSPPVPGTSVNPLNASSTTLGAAQPVTQSVNQGSSVVSQLSPAQTAGRQSALSVVSASIASNPSLPQAFVDTTMPATTKTVTVGPSGSDYTDLQQALNEVSLGTTILLKPGVTYMSSNDAGFILPNKTTGSGWIVIRPDLPDSALPAPGTRIDPSYAPILPKILRGNVNVYAMSVAPSAHNFRIIGVEF